MNYDLLLLFLFGLVLLGIMLLNKKRVHIEKILFPAVYMVLYRTKVGLNFMDRTAKKYPRFVKWFGILGIIFGFIGMAAILALLIYGTYGFLFLDKEPPVAPLFPGVKTVPGMPVLGFWHWIIAIFILAGVHEFSHGLISRFYDIKVKSSGFAVFSLLLPILPAAFVEPDEEQLNKSDKKTQLSVLAGGSFSNLITGGVFFLIFSFLLAPVVSSITISEGVIVRGVFEEAPASDAGIKVGENIQEINGVVINDVDGFVNYLSGVKPKDELKIKTNESLYSVIAGENNGKGYLGVNVSAEKQYLDENYGIFGKILSWITLLFFWIFVANIGVGLFNLLPLGPLDGGRMFYLSALKFAKNEKLAKKIWIGVSVFCAGLILISLMPFVFKLLTFTIGIIGLI